MKRLECMKDTLIDIVQEQLQHPDCTNTKELGEAVDMIKDLSKTIYYCTIVEAMEHSHENGEEYSHDSKEGKSPMARKIYMESKAVNKEMGDVKSLEHYLKELCYDLTEIIDQAAPEEKALIKQKLSGMISKI